MSNVAVVYRCCFSVRDLASGHLTTTSALALRNRLRLSLLEPDNFPNKGEKMLSAGGNKHFKWPLGDSHQCREHPCGKNESSTFSRWINKYLERILSVELRHEVKVFPSSQDVEESARTLRIVARGSHQLALLVNVWHCGKSSAWCHPDWCARSADSDYSQNSAGARTARRRVSGWELQNKTPLAVGFLPTGSLK